MPDPILAVGVAILVPTQVHSAASLLNEQLSPTLRFDSSHLPHITLLQQFMAGGKLSRAQAALERVATPLGPFPIHVTRMRAQRFDDDTHVVYWEIERSEPLTLLHNRVSAAFASLARAGNGESFFNEESRSIRASTIKYVEEFRRKYAGDNFEPHLTLGFGDRDLRQAPFSWTADRVAICHLGELNTCRRVLYEQRLRARVRRSSGRRQAKQSV